MNKNEINNILNDLIKIYNELNDKNYIIYFFLK